MRGVWILLVLLLPLAGAVEDDVGDHEVGVRTWSLDEEDNVQWLPANPLGWYPESDLVEASVAETQNEVVFTVRWAGSGDDLTEPQQFFFLWYDFTFDLRGVETIGRFDRFMWDDDGEFDYFRLGVPTEDRFGGMRVHSSWPAERVAPDTMQVVFPKQYFVDADFVPLRQGDSLKDIQLTVRNDEFGFPTVPLPACPHVYTTTNPPFASPGFCDFRVRDELTGLGDLNIELQPDGVGHLLMRADKPWRFSNGLATTYLYEVEVHNFDEERDEVAFSATEVPKGWEVLHPAKVSFDSKGMTTIPVAVTVPFAHQHGDIVQLQLQGVSDKDPDTEVGTWLGVIYADPAQPGGHHPTLYFHATSFGFSDRLWMNTASYQDPEEIDRATGWYRGQDVDVAGSRINGLPTEAHWTWSSFLSPSLQMGMDFDLNGQVTAELAFEVGSGITATPSGTLKLFTREGIIDLAELTGGEITIAPGETVEAKLTGSPLPEADRIESGTGNLFLEIRLDGIPQPEESLRMITGTEAVLVLDGSSLTLPLLDFHEEVDLSGLELNAYTLGGNRSYAEVNPEKAVAFVFNVTNLLSETETIQWALSGKHAEWGRVLPGQTLIDGGGIGQVVVEVVPPATAQEGDVAELLLMGTDSEERQVFIRMTAAVVTDEEIDDESGVADEVAKDVTKKNEDLKKDSPGFEMIALVALLAAIAVLLRRRER